MLLDWEYESWEERLSHAMSMNANRNPERESYTYVTEEQ